MNKQKNKKEKHGGSTIVYEQRISAPKKLVIAIVGCSFLLSSCTVVPTVAHDVTPTKTSSIEASQMTPELTTKVPTPTATVRPTETPTPKPTEIQIADPLDVNNYQIVDGNIQEKRGGSWKEISVPYEAGYIAYVEIHDGKAYGIDTADRAVVVRNDSGEWVKFERPIFGADFDNYVFEDEFRIITLTIDQSNLDLSDVPITEINRLNDSEGNSLKWGYLGDPKDWDTSYKMYDFITSGYFLGTAGIHTKIDVKETGQIAEANDPARLVFEIPHKYYRQIVLVNQAVENEMTYVIMGNYPHASDTFEINGLKLNKYLLENIDTMRGQQIILNLNLNPSDKYSQLFWDSQLTENGGYNYPAPMGSGFFWFSSNFPANKIQ